MNAVTLNATSRAATGTRKAKQLRRDGVIPAVIYGKEGSQKLNIASTEFKKLWKQVLGTTAIIEVKVDGKSTHSSLIQEVQRNSRTDEFLHIDFQEVSATEAIQTPVAIHIKGEAIGVKQENGTIEQVLHEIIVRSLPKNLPSFIEINIENLHVGEAIHVKTLPVFEGVEYVEDEDLVVVSCMASKVESEEESEEGEEAAAGAESSEKAETAGDA